MKVDLALPGDEDGPSARVIILHDNRSFANKGVLEDGSTPQFEQVFECRVSAFAYAPDVLETCFEEFNVGESSDVAQAYRRGTRLRSLSTGDVVVIGDTAYRCESVGWSRFPLYSPRTT